MLKKKLLKNSLKPSPPPKKGTDGNDNNNDNKTGKLNKSSKSSISPLKRYRTSKYWENNIESQVKRVFANVDKKKKGVIKRLELMKAFVFDENGDGNREAFLSHPKLRQIIQPKIFSNIINESSSFIIKSPSSLQISNRIKQPITLNIVVKRNKICVVRERMFLKSVQQKSTQQKST